MTDSDVAQTGAFIRDDEIAQALADANGPVILEK